MSQAQQRSPKQVSSLLKRLVLGRSIKRSLIRAAFIAVISILFFSQILRPYIVETKGMSPTIKEGELVWVNKAAYWGDDSPRPGDIVAVRLAGESVIRISRIAALPGDRVALKDGYFYVNEKAFDQSRFVLPEPYPEQKVPNEHFFLLGDNRSLNIFYLNSEGAFGKVSKERIIGEVIF